MNRDIVVPPPGPEREALRVEQVVAKVAEIEAMPAFISHEDALGIARQMTAHALGEPDARTDEERERHDAAIERVARVVPSTDPGDADARALAVLELASAEQALGVVEAALASVEAEHGAAVRTRDDQVERARVAREAFAARSIKDSEKRRRELRIDAETAEDGEALAGAAVDVAARRVGEVKSSRDAAAEVVAVARAAVARIDLRAEAKLLAAVEATERARRNRHAKRVQTWTGKMDGSTPAGVDLRSILIEAGAIAAPAPREQVSVTSVMVSFGAVGARGPIALEASDEQLEFLAELGVQILPVSRMFRYADLSGKTIAGDAMKPPLQPIEVPSRAPTPVPEGSSTPYGVGTGIMGPRA